MSVSSSVSYCSCKVLLAVEEQVRCGMIKPFFPKLGDNSRPALSRSVTENSKSRHISYFFEGNYIGHI